MMIVIKFILSAAIVLICTCGALSQVEEVTDSTKIITMKNGESRVGEIISDDGRQILFLSKDIGKVYILKQDIKSVQLFKPEVAESVDGDYFVNSPFHTGYFFSTNARPLKKGEDYAMLNLYGPEIHFSVTDRLSLGVMTTWIASPFILAAKYSIPTKNPMLNFGIGTLLGSPFFLTSFRGFGGLHFGMATYGDEKQNLTVSLGYSYMNLGVYIDSRLSTAPVFSISGIKKITKRTSFFFDSMIFLGKSSKPSGSFISDPVTGGSYYQVTGKVDYRNTIVILMPGMRFQSGQRSAFQFALAGVLYSERNLKTALRDVVPIPIPQCSWLLKF